LKDFSKSDFDMEEPPPLAGTGAYCVPVLLRAPVATLAHRVPCENYANI